MAPAALGQSTVPKLADNVTRRCHEELGFVAVCDTRFSGTSFYRHRKTGYEEITEENRNNYKLSLDNDMRIHGVPKKEYMNGDSLLFEAIFSNELKFNGAIIYPCRILHAANIKRQFNAPKDKSEW